MPEFRSNIIIIINFKISCFSRMGGGGNKIEEEVKESYATVKILNTPVNERFN